jgi:RNA-directed DNA polymerase
VNISDFYYAAAHHLRVSASQVEKVVRTAPFRYKHYTIKKRNGGRRDIHHPSPVLKSLQRWIIRGPIAGLPVHEAVFSYRAGRNIAMNAMAHVKSNYFSRFDFEAFFPSITNELLKTFLISATKKGHICLDEDVVAAVARAACRATDIPSKDVLSVGAPSSPYLSNAILFEFDCAVFDRAKAVGVVYTRYADDIFLSSSDLNALIVFERVFREIVKERVPFLRLNEDKHQHFSRRRRVTITGVNVTSDRKISVGRSLKRSIRTRLHLALAGSLDSGEFSSLRGAIAHVMSVEPLFLDSLRNKFGSKDVDAFMEFAPRGEARRA